MALHRWSNQLTPVTGNSIRSDSLLVLESIEFGNTIVVIVRVASSELDALERFLIRLVNPLSFRVLREEFVFDPVSSACLEHGSILIDADSTLRQEILDSGIEVPTLVAQSVHYIIATETLVLDALCTGPIQIEKIN